MVDEKIDQYMKPHGEEGIQIIEHMNESHQDSSEFALECINIKDNDKILDIGCGGGVNIEKFLKLTTANVDGLDYSEISIAESVKRNHDAIDAKRCKIIHADVSNMPIPDEEYDLISAFETIYFWPDIQNTFKEVFRILKPSGKFMICQETDGNHPEDERWLATVEGMTIYTPKQLETYLLNAGFSNVEIFKKENEYMIVVIGEK